jgi:hypothetical protein
MTLVALDLSLYIFVFVFVYYKRHTASTSITAVTHPHGAQHEGSPQNPDQIEQHSHNGPWIRN